MLVGTAAKIFLVELEMVSIFLTGRTSHRFKLNIIMSSVSERDYGNRFLLPPGVGETENVENYTLGGFHHTHLRDKFDEGRYRVMHKLGTGEVSTVWLARDEQQSKWA